MAKALADSDDIDIRIDQLAGVRMPKLLAAKSLQAALMALRESGAPSRLANNRASSDSFPMPNFHPKFKLSFAVFAQGIE